MSQPNKDALKVMQATRTCETLMQLSIADNLIKAWTRKHNIRNLDKPTGAEICNFWETVSFMRNVWENTNRNIFAANRRERNIKLNKEMLITGVK